MKQFVLNTCFVVCHVSTHCKGVIATQCVYCEQSPYTENTLWNKTKLS